MDENWLWVGLAATLYVVSVTFKTVSVLLRRGADPAAQTASQVSLVSFAILVAVALLFALSKRSHTYMEQYT